MLKIIFSLVWVFACALLANEQSIFELMQGEQTGQKANPQINTTYKQSNPDNSSQSKSANYSLPLNFDVSEISGILGTDEPEPTKDELYQYSHLGDLDITLSTSAQSVYVYEPFYIDVVAHMAGTTRLNPSLSIKSNGAKLINKKINFTELAQGEYSTRLWFELTSLDASIDEIAVVMKRGGELVKRSGKAPKMPTITPLEPKDDFCNVVADELIIKSIKSSKFNELNNLILIKLEVRNGNLSEFSLPKKYQKQGIENLKGDISSMSANYFIISNQDETNIKFSYFNAISKSYKSFDLPIKISGDNLSTQTNLNPKTSELATYKSIIIYAITIVCLLSFVLWRSIYGLILGIIFIVYALYDARPFSEVTVKPNTEISILPMENSRIFYTIKNEKNLKILGTYKNYTKVLLDDDKIGWIQNQSIK